MKSNDDLLPKYNSKCFFLSNDKSKCNALIRLSCDNWKFFKNKNNIKEISHTIEFLKHEKALSK